MAAMEKLTEGEEAVMKAVWDCKDEPTMTEVFDIVTTVYGKDWRQQTVSTFLGKLVRKNYLKLRRNGRTFHYIVLVKEEDYRRKLYRHHIDFWNHEDVVEFIAEMIRNKDLTDEDIKAAIEK